MRVFDSIAPFRFSGKRTAGKFTAFKEAPYSDKSNYKKKLRKLQQAIDERQQAMYADDRRSLLVVFQAMDAAGKDGTIRRVFSGVNPHGVAVHDFKKPSDKELEHDFLWRTIRDLPRRGQIGVFNRSYYEEVLVCQVHPGIITDVQKMPRELTSSGAAMKRLWEGRYASICEHEAHLARNGTRVLKFFLNVSKEEQANRFRARIDEPEKNWKFNEGDVAERSHWDSYMKVYDKTLAETDTEDSPWYILPADDKKGMRLLAAQIVLETLEDMKMGYPEVSEARRAELLGYRGEI